ncbi:putative lipid II flippase FtsW [Candidatus Microgenomates bacterium]|nr:putative lipid II flippase FtsW [Candidatus Microgenomates bacterium]
MRNIDLSIFLITVILVLFGVLMVYDASSVIAFRDFGDKYHFIKDQIRWVAVGFIFLVFFANLDYHLLIKLAIPLLILTIVFLVSVFIPGLGIKASGASRWLDFKFFVLQPTEFAKLSLTIYLAAWFANKEKGRFWAFLLLLMVVVGLVIAQPDMGTGIILASTSIALYFLSGASILHFLLILPIFALTAFAFIKIAPYRMARVLTFFDPLRDPQGTSYHIQQILIALGSGGLVGLGLGQSKQKFEYLPEAMTDSIFAIIGEEIGFIGTLFLLLLFILLFARCFKVAREARDNFGRLLAGGIVSFLAIQTVINIGAQVALLPLTGVPLPFISYGGSSLIISLSAIGIILNISKVKGK